MAKKVASTRKKEKKNDGDVITVQGVGSNTAIAAGRGAKASVTNTNAVTSSVNWRVQINQVIDSAPNISQAEKEDLKRQIEKISDEIQKGPKVETGRLEKLINVLGVMAPDIFEVIVATLANPLMGIGLVIKKIGDKAKLKKTTSRG